MTSKAGGAADKEIPAAPSAGRTAIWQVLLLSLVVALVGGALYYGIKLAHTSAFNDERAFRVLGSMVAQVNNLQVSREMTLRTAPADAIRDASREATKKFCPVSANSQLTPDSQTTAARQFLAKLDLQQAAVCVGPKPTEPPADNDFVTRSCAAAGKDTQFQFSRVGQLFRIVTIDCNGRASLLDSFDARTNHFIGQGYFDNVLLAVGTGNVLAEFPQNTQSGEANRVSFHSVQAQELSLTDVSRLLMRSRGEVVSMPGIEPDSSPKDPKPEAVTGQPMAFRETIGSTAYRVYVLPFNASRAVLSSSGEPATESTLYFIGIQRENTTKNISNALWPDGAWLITLGTVTALLIWPLLGIAFGSLRESLSPSRVVLCLFAAVVLPGVLAIAVASMWGYASTENWLRHNAKAYAQSIEGKLHAELLAGARVLSANKALYEWLLDKNAGTDNPPKCEDLKDERAKDFAHEVESSRYVIRSDDATLAIATPSSSFKPDNTCNTLQVSAIDTRENSLRNWSPIRNVIAYNADGARFGPSITSFGNVASSRALQVPDREYFQAVKRGEFWVSDDLGSDRPFVAQRLYNKSDASKALQVAVPLCIDSDNPLNFCGLLTGAMRIHSLIDPISPPLLQFAVIDRDSGMVLFHSDDKRSLTENFFVETESDFLLQAAIRASREGAFSGSYLGVAHGFYYAPVQDTPWGVVTFYSRKDLYDLPAHAGTAALAVFVGGALMFGFTLYLVCRLFRTVLPVTPRTESFLGGRWPTLPMNPRLRAFLRLRPSLWAMVFAMLAVVCGTPFQVWHIACVVIIACLISRGLPQRQRRNTKLTETTKSYQTRVALADYLDLFRTLVIVFSVGSGLCLYFRFHDHQIAGLLRTSVAKAADDYRGRLDLIQSDLQRWDANANGFPERYPAAATILRKEEPEYFGSKSTDQTLFNSQPWSPKGVITQPTQIEATIWSLTAGSTDQAVRQSLLTRTPASGEGHAGSEINCWYQRVIGPKPLRLESTLDQCELRDSYGRRNLATLNLGPRSKPFSVASADNQMGAYVLVLALIGLWLTIDGITRFVARRVLGLETSYQSRGHPKPQAADFHSSWKSLKDSQKVLLADVANGHLPNPRSDAETMKLVDAGWINVDGWPRIASNELKASIREASPDINREPTRDESNTWRRIRIPLFVVLMIAIAGLNWAAGGAMKAFSALLLGSLAFMTQISSVANFVRGSQSSGK